MEILIIRKSLFILLGLLLLPVADSGAQSIFLEPNSVPAIQLEALRPGSTGVNFSTFSFEYFLSANIPSGENLRVRLELPYMHYQVESSSYYNGNSESRSSVGNPYLGIDVGPTREGWQGEFGFRLPVVDEDSEASGLGVMTDPVERMEAFLRNVIPLYIGVNYRYRAGNGFALRLRLLPVLWFDSGGGSGQETEVFLIHSIQTWYESGKVGAGAGFSGRLALSGDDGDFGQNTIYQFGFFANYDFGSFLPGFQVRIPLDRDLKDYSQSTAYSLSVGVKI